MPQLRYFLFATALLALCGVSAFGQSSSFATITGTVTDTTGAVIPGTEIEVTHVETGYKFETESNEAGQFTIANLREGTFRLVATSPGFRVFVAGSIILKARDTRRVNVALQVGAVEQTIEVTAGASLIETETAALADTKDRTVLRELPLTLRRAWDYYTMTPTVDRTSNWHISIGGSRRNQSVATMDGAPINDAFGGTAIGPLMDKSESLQELRIDAGQSNADQATMGQVNLISRAGTNDFHGAISDYYSTPSFRARNPFNASKSSARAHTVTFSGGGPIFVPKVYDGRNKSFFFFTWEGGFGSPNQSNLNNTVPLESWRRGDFSAENVQLSDPFNGGAPFPGNQIPANRINQTSKTLQENFYALPNFGDPNVFVANNYRESRTVSKKQNPTTTLRLDHRLKDNALIYGRWTAVRWNLENFDSQVPTVQETYRRRRDMDSLAISYTHTFSPSMMNEFRYGFTRQDFPREAALNGLEVVNLLGLQGLAPNLPDVGGMHRVRYSGLGITELQVGNTCGPCGQNRIHNFTNNFNWYRGNHALKFGTFIARGLTGARSEGNALFGQEEFSNRYTSHPYGDFLLGIPTTMNRDFPALGRENWTWTTSFYVSDQWKVTPTLTLNLGVRWDIYHPFKEKNDQMAVFDIGTGSVVVPDGALSRVSPLMPTDYVPIVEASQAGFPKSLIETDWNNFAPRFGFAWRPLGPDTVVRGGVGIYYDTATDMPSSGSTPFNIAEPSFTNLADNPLMYPVAFPTGGVAGPQSISLPGAKRLDLRIPRSMQYTLTIETQKWDTGFRATYTGTNTRQGIYNWNINSPVADDQLFINKARMFPRFPGINFTDNGAGHQYHALTLEAERRMSKGIHFQTYFTWARDIGDLDRGTSPEYAFDRLRERGPMDRVPLWRWSGNFIWEIPYGRGRFFGSNSHNVANAILGGWNLTGIFALEHGRYITPQIRMPDPTGTAFTSSGNRPSVTIRPDHLFDANLDDPQVDQWFDPNGFGRPAIGGFGSSARGVLVGAPVEVLHAGIAKNFFFKERIRFRVEMLANNVLNHPNYRDPNLRIDQQGTAARVTQYMNRNLKFDSAIPRELQLQLRLEW